MRVSLSARYLSPDLAMSTKAENGQLNVGRVRKPVEIDCWGIRVTFPRDSEATGPVLMVFLLRVPLVAQVSAHRSGEVATPTSANLTGNLLQELR